MRMENYRLPKLAFLSELKNGKRSIGRPLLRYKGQLKTTLSACALNRTDLEAQGVPNPSDPEKMRYE